MIYADTSFLFSFYAYDDNSARAVRAYESDPRRPLWFGPWQRFELRNSIRLAVHRLKRSGQIVSFQPGNVYKQIEEDLEAGRLKHAEVDWPESMRLAEDLSAKYTEATGAASTDVWHVAAAKLLEADTFWSFDEAQRDLAARTAYFKHTPKLKG